MRSGWPRWRRGEGFAGWVVGAPPADLHPLRRARRPARPVLPGVRGGEVPVDGVGAADRARTATLFGVIGLHSLAPRDADGGRRHLRDPLRVAGGRRDRERAPVRGDAPPRARAGAAVRDLRPVPPRADRRWPSCCPRSPRRRCDLLDADQVVRRTPSSAASASSGARPAPARRHGAAVPAAAGRGDELPAAVARGDARRPAPWRCRWPVDGEVLGHVVALARVVRVRRGRARPARHGRRPDGRRLASKIELIDGLTERNLTKDFFGDLAGRPAGGRRGPRAARLGCDLASPRLAVVVLPHDRGGRGPTPSGSRPLERFEADVGRELAGVVFDRRDDRGRGLVPGRRTGRRDVASSGSARALGGAAAGGRRVEPRAPAPRAWRPALAEARQAARRGAGRHRARRRRHRSTASGRTSTCCACSPRTACATGTRDALRRLVDYDRRAPARSCAGRSRSTWRRRGNISATAQALYVHPNTLRQRLRRIEEITGLDVREGDWLMIEIALKLLRLEELVP